jgi:hypothetical protein
VETESGEIGLETKLMGVRGDRLGDEVGGFVVDDGDEVGAVFSADAAQV